MLSNIKSSAASAIDHVIGEFNYWWEEFVMEVSSWADDIEHKALHLWYWDPKFEKQLIRLKLRKEFDFDRCFDLIGGCDDDVIDSSNYHLPQRYELQEFIDFSLEEDFSSGEIPATTIEVAQAYLDEQEHEAWIKRAMDPACSDY